MEMKVFVIAFCLTLSLVEVCESANHTLVIGVILHDDDYETQVALTYAMRKINMFSQDFDRLGQRRQKSGQLVYLPNIQTVPKHDSFKTGKVACSMLESGVSAILGPDTLTSTGIVQSICSTMDIPHIQTNWNPTDTPFTSQTVMNMHPDPRAMSKAIARLVKAAHWKTYTVLYQNEDGLVRLQDVLKISRKQSAAPITVRQLGDGPDFRFILKEVRKSQINNVVLDCEVDFIVPILTQARDVGLLEDYQSYILTSLDAHTVDFGHLLDLRPNITTLRLVDPNTPEVQQAVGDWALWEERNTGNKLQIEAKSLRLKTALMYDAVNLYAAAVKDLHSTEPIKLQKFNCEDEGDNTWEHGLRIIEYMKVKHTPSGLTGPIKFDALGRRTDFEFQVVELASSNQTVTGTATQYGYHSLRSDLELQMQIETSIQSKLFIVSSRIGPPYLSHRKPKNGEVLTGNDRYEGYSMDLIDGISKILNFTYRFELAPDGRYGSLDKEKQEWNGLIKQLLLRKADLAICDLTITYDRRTAVDFTMPFMTLGISILYSKQADEAPNLFSFTSPLSTDVWLYMATAFLGVSFLMFVLARMSPSDWENPHPCNQTPEELENAWDFKNCLWFTLGGIMAQGCDILPKGISTRMLSGIWWFFALILLSSYTANLAAFLTMQRMGPSIESAEDLAKQSKIKYGAVKDGSTLEFFKKSNFSTYQRMWAAMESARPSVFMDSNSDGVERVLKGKRGYAFLMESTQIEYEVEKNCAHLTQVGGLLDSKGYGIAMPVNGQCDNVPWGCDKATGRARDGSENSELLNSTAKPMSNTDQHQNSPYRTSISGAVLRMQEDGLLYELKDKWWKKMQNVQCEKETKEVDSSTSELDLDNVGGVFVVLFGGMGIAFVIAILEFMWNVRKVAVDEQMTLCEALTVELKFALNIFITKKAANPKLSEKSSDSGSETKSIAQSVLNKAGSFLHLNVFNELNTNKKSHSPQ